MYSACGKHNLDLKWSYRSVCQSYINTLHHVLKWLIILLFLYVCIHGNIFNSLYLQYMNIYIWHAHGNYHCWWTEYDIIILNNNSSICPAWMLLWIIMCWIHVETSLDNNHANGYPRLWLHNGKTNVLTLSSFCIYTNLFISRN